MADDKEVVMRILGILILAAGLVALGAQPGHAGEVLKSATLEGEVLDLACYMAHEGRGKKHAKCAKQCALAGSPIGLLAKDRVYLLVDDHHQKKAFEEAKKLAGEDVRVTGKLAIRGGVAAVIVERVEKR